MRVRFPDDFTAVPEHAKSLSPAGQCAVPCREIERSIGCDQAVEYRGRIYGVLRQELVSFVRGATPFELKGLDVVEPQSGYWAVGWPETLTCVSGYCEMKHVTRDPAEG
jgi:hypothetical protein